MSGTADGRDGFMREPDLHRECWELLPWLANERLAAKDQERIGTHLRECAQCQQELAEQRQLRDAVRVEDSIVIAPQASLQKLMQRLDHDGGREAGPAETFETASPSSAGRAAGRWPRWIAVAAGVQGILIFALMAAIWMQAREQLEAPRFTTLTSPAVVAHGPVIRVVFAEGVALQDASGIIRSVDAQVVAGPSEAGVYTLSLAGPAPRPSDAKSAIDAALAVLRADPRIVFAESAIAKNESP
jgi:hypothetical protein